MRFPAVLPVALLVIPACLSADKGDEEEILDDTKADSFYHPTDHGPIAWDVPAHSELTADERHHTWTFELSGDAEVELTTSYSIRGQRRIDTVLYLYKE